jgi:threonine aldolase
MNLISLSSDTETKPTPAMRTYMANAEVGDEQKGEDPTVNKLLERVAGLLGKEAALFLPGGTMCNFIAVKVHTRPADVVFADRMAHIIRAESGGVAFSSGVMVEPIPSERGIFSANDLQSSLNDVVTVPNPYSPVPRLLCIEQTHNFGFGSVWSLEEMRSVTALARTNNLAVHIDGARLMNACVASGVAAKDFAALADSVWIDFTKGLGAPVGAVLAGSRGFVQEARRHKHIFGGAMRQAGIVAAGCLYALDHHIERLAEDHANARLLATGLSHIDGIELANPAPESNMVFFSVQHSTMDNTRLLEELKHRGISMGKVGKHIRAVTHLDVSTEDIHTVIRGVEASMSLQ